MTKCHRLCGLKYRNTFSHISGNWKAKGQDSDRLCSLVRTICQACKQLPLWWSKSSKSSSFSYKGTSSIKSRLHTKILFNLNPHLKDTIFNTETRGLRLQHITSGKHNSVYMRWEGRHFWLGASTFSFSVLFFPIVWILKLLIETRGGHMIEIWQRADIC